MISLKEKYNTEVAPQLKDELGLGNPMQTPRVSKVVVSLGVKATERDILKDLAAELRMLTGQTPSIRKARKSISNFKLREGMDIGAKVTLRGERMYDFLCRLINAALPRIRDFRGVSATNFDGNGNYNLGIEDQTIFPELDPDNVKRVHGFNIAIVTTAQTDDEAYKLLKRLGMPLVERK